MLISQENFPCCGHNYTKISMLRVAISAYSTQKTRSSRNSKMMLHTTHVKTVIANPVLDTYKQEPNIELIRMGSQIRNELGVIHDFAEPRSWRNVPQCVVRCCQTLIDRMNTLE